MSQPHPTVQQPQGLAVLLDKAQGCVLGLMCGDALGAAVEGFDRHEILKVAQEHCNGDAELRDFIPAVHMGSFVANPDPDLINAPPVPARSVTDVRFLPTGPPSKPSWAAAVRYGHYTDDTNACLALATSLVEQQALDGAHAAKTYSVFWQTEPIRGYPPTAKAVMQAILDGADYRKTGQPPYFQFTGGSFANGGAMRISPLSIAYRNATAPALRAACAEAIRSSHVHPEAVDGAVVQATAVQYCLGLRTAADFSPQTLLDVCVAACTTEAMQDRLRSLVHHLCQDPQGHGAEGFGNGVTGAGAGVGAAVESDYAVLSAVLTPEHRRPGSALGFQIAAVDMMPCVFYFVCRYFREPELAIIRSVNIGGDTDTTASMVGAIMGALHGVAFVPPRWADNLENGPYGRDYALQLAARLVQLDLQ